MIQACGCLGLSDEACLVLGVFDRVRGQELQRNGPFQLRVLGLVDDTHAAPADFGEDLVVADSGVDHDIQIVALRDNWRGLASLPVT